MNTQTRPWSALRRLGWLVLLLFISACGGGTTSGANTLMRGVPQDDVMADNDGMNEDGAGDAGQDGAENGGAAPANGEDEGQGLTIGGQL